MKKHFLFILFLISLNSIRAQVGGSYTYSFLKLAPNARVAALGETNITTADWDVSMQLSNPALLNPQMNKQANFSSVIHPGGINYGNLNYAQNVEKLHATFGGGIHYIAYGNMERTNAEGQSLGKMNAGEMALYGGGAYRFGSLFSVGANLQIIYSGLDIYKSFGITADLGATVQDKKSIFIGSLVAKNIGGQIVSYSKNTKELVPFNLQAAFAVKIPQVPIKIHYTLHDLSNWNIRYYNPADNANTNLFQDSTTTKVKNHTGDEIMRHMIFGFELNIKKIVFFDISYNHQRRMELKQDTRRGMAGVSVGLGLKVNPISFFLGITPMPLNQTLAHFSLNINTAGFTKKKK